MTVVPAGERDQGHTDAERGGAPRRSSLEKPFEGEERPGQPLGRGFRKVAEKLRKPERQEAGNRASDDPGAAAAGQLQDPEVGAERRRHEGKEIITL